MAQYKEFSAEAHAFIEWISEYFENVENFPVMSQVAYGDIKGQFPKHPPEDAEIIDDIFSDFKKKILPGITHWQSPRYFAYFPANSSTPSVLAEILTAALGVQGMKWITSPASTELEELVMQWLRQMIGLPEEFQGVIHDTASIATLCAVIAARERVTNYNSNAVGTGNYRLRYYCSTEAHSSVDKAIRIAGIGSDNLIKIDTDSTLRMDPEKLEAAILRDLEYDLKPTGIVAALGTTGTCAIDPIKQIAEIAKKYGLWLHVDAAFAGSAMVLPEFRKEISGLDKVDSFVFNPHKWMFTNFDCSAFFVRDGRHLQNTFSLVPEYLTRPDDHAVNDFSNWGLHLGRRFRALKLWFVIRNFGVKGIQERIRKHIELARYVEQLINDHEQFELVVPRNLTVLCFRYVDKKGEEPDILNELNAKLLECINKTGKAYLSHTVIDGKYTLRFVCAQTNTERRHIDDAWEAILDCGTKII